MSDFFHRNKKRVLLGGLALGIVYLVIHFLIFDKEFQYDGIWNFILEGRAHTLHVAPVIIVFLWLTGLTIRDRIREKKNGKQDNHPEGRA